MVLYTVDYSGGDIVVRGDGTLEVDDALRLLQVFTLTALQPYCVMVCQNVFPPRVDNSGYEY